MRPVMETGTRVQGAIIVGLVHHPSRDQREAAQEVRNSSMMVYFRSRVFENESYTDRESTPLSKKALPSFFVTTMHRLYPLYAWSMRHVRSSRLLCRSVFGFAPKRGTVTAGEVWDWTAVGLRNAMRKHVAAIDSMLDMGTGPYAVLSIHAAKRLGVRTITAVDVLPVLISRARAVAMHAECKIDFLVSDLFENVLGTFDVIVFNAPYVPVERGRALKIIHDHLTMQRISGGEDGSETVSRFLAGASRHLTTRGRILLGVNRRHVDVDLIRHRIEQARYVIRSCVSLPLVGAVVFIIQPDPSIHLSVENKR